MEELHPERLATTAEDGSRVYLHTASVKGKFRNIRNIVYDILVVIFLCIPWIRIGGQPVLLLDLPNRHFSILGLTFWGHDAPILFLVFTLFVVSIGLITAVFGRGWCGWACPQTVFIDRVFVRIERWIEGDAVSQRKLEAAPMSFGKAAKRGVKWMLFFIAALVITHSFLAYFVGTDQLAKMVTHSPLENPSSFLVIAIATAIILFDFGWFREQFCIIACPYGRLQSVLMDDHSLVVAYDEKRGEPRWQKGMDRTKTGDCVNCFRCVQVCPTGIDIRRGVQMECIGCTACIDACDEVMTKTNKPKGLIRYDTEAALKKEKSQPIRLRTILYSVFIVFAAITLFFVVSSRELIKVNFVHALDKPFQLVREGQEVINHYKVNVRNQNPHDIELEFYVSDELKAKGISLVVPLSPLKVSAGQSVRTDLFVTFPRAFSDQKKLTTVVHVRSMHPDHHYEESIKSIPLIGPGES
jgi:cytochrome c oxidase accessory protein FixG